MGRPRTKDKDLPPRMRRRGKRYYYRAQGREIPLGPDLVKARTRWAELENQHLTDESLFKSVAQKFEDDEVPLKAPRTQKDYKRQLALLVKVFGATPVCAIEPHHVRRYHSLRMKVSLVQANRERMLLSTVFNWARGQGYYKGPNPCQGIRGKKERPRGVYVDDAAFKAVWDKAPAGVRDGMDLARLTSQRPADVLKMALTNLRDGCLEVEQNKTKTKVRIEVTGELAAVIERIKAQMAARPMSSIYLVQHEDGQPITYWQFAKLFQAAREAAGELWQFRDLRAKAATEKDEESGPREAQKLLGHASVTTTEGYIRNRRGARVKPLK
jgi:integrase